MPSDPKRGLYGGRRTARGQESPIQYPLAGPHDAPSWGAGYKKALREQANHQLTISNFITQLPVETNRVALESDVKDTWGLQTASSLQPYKRLPVMRLPRSGPDLPIWIAVPP